MRFEAILISTTAIAALFALAVAECGDYGDCASCAGADGGDCEFCVTTSVCASRNQIDCKPANLIKTPFDCPAQAPSKEFAYDDHFARYTIYPLIGATYTAHPQDCFRNQNLDYQLVSYGEIVCDPSGHNNTCAVYVAVGASSNTVVVGFRGTHGNWELVDEILSALKLKKKFEAGGKVYSYFYNSFYALFDDVIAPALTKAKQLCPQCDHLITTGHSLGGSFASLFGTVAIHRGLFDAAKTRTITIGQPRTGDLSYAMAHDRLHKYSYRVVHRQDPVPHLPPKLGSDPVYHHRFEVWYDNDMASGAQYNLCLRADDDSCSNGQLELQFNDHTHYFWMIPVSDWGSAGCNSSLPQ